MEALEHEHACYVVKVQGSNAGAGGTLYLNEEVPNKNLLREV